MKRLFYLSIFAFACSAHAGLDKMDVDSSGVYDIELTDLSLEFTPIVVHLKWEVSYEENGAFFIVEKSIDGQNWEEKSRRKSVGNHDTYQVYLESISNFPEAALEYFRLKRIDSNGEEMILDMTAIRHPPLSDLKLFVDHQDINGNVTVTFESLEKGKAIVSIYDIAGKIQSYKRHDLSVGYNRKSMSLSGLDEGTYQIVVEDLYGNKISKRWVVHKSKRKRK